MRRLKPGDLTLKRRKDRHEAQSFITVGSDIYVRASTVTSRRSTCAILNDEGFAVFDLSGDILESPFEPLGFFHRDTRHLSRFELRVTGESPRCLSSHTSRAHGGLRVMLANPDLALEQEDTVLPGNTIHIERNWVIVDAALFHKLVVRNYSTLPVRIPLDFLFDVDFADLFEVRGVKRIRRGDHSEPHASVGEITFAYRGLDGVRRYTNILFDPEPAALEAKRASFVLTLAPGEQTELEARITCESETTHARTSSKPPSRFDQALTNRRSETSRLGAGWSTVSASSDALNSLLQSSSADLTAMTRAGPDGTFLMAGVPWFATLFGRDSILGAMLVLPFNPKLAAGTLRALAALQATEVNSRRDEQPGKIVHEVRYGEMAATGEVPFGRYYGSVDATPLFLCLLGRYVATTGDLELADRLWSNAERALDWIERWGDSDGDLYVEYRSANEKGLSNQGWKDSGDAVSHADGTLARPPIALCEVQGYVHTAYSLIAGLARRLGREDTASRLDERAARLRACFSRDFWIEREGTVALALDADKKPCCVMASNAAHLLATDLLDNQQSEALASRLMREDIFTGWGIRTLGSRERRYNPMSYHNGSVWPHDNAIAAAGLARINGRRGVIRILESLVEAASQLRTGSLPELFCGFPRDGRLGPVPYPVACHPQAWSAASIFMMVQAVLGIEVRGFERRLVVNSPAMPEWLDWLKIENLKVSDGSVSLVARRSRAGASIDIIETRGDVTVDVIDRT